MTVNVARRRSKVRAAAGAPDGSVGAIGEISQTVFACPACGRPLAIGVRRCPGCSTHLLLGVQLGRASKFVTVGLIAGIALGGGFGAVVTAVRQPAHDAQVAETAAAAALTAHPAVAQPVASAAAIATAKPPTGSGGGSTGSGTVKIPPISASALTQAILLNAKLADSSADFKAALAASKFSASDVSQLLRDASVDSVIGLQLAQSVNAWSGGTVVSSRLSTFYATVQTTAAEGLAASIRNDAAYRGAATAMVQLLSTFDTIDAQARALATSNGISLPADPSPAP